MILLTCPLFPPKSLPIHFNPLQSNSTAKSKPQNTAEKNRLALPAGHAQDPQHSIWLLRGGIEGLLQSVRQSVGRVRTETQEGKATSMNFARFLVLQSPSLTYAFEFKAEPRFSNHF